MLGLPRPFEYLLMMTLCRYAMRQVNLLGRSCHYPLYLPGIYLLYLSPRCLPYVLVVGSLGAKFSAGSAIPAANSSPHPSTAMHFCIFVPKFPDVTSVNFDRFWIAFKFVEYVTA